jgi:hypothetical protein
LDLGPGRGFLLFCSAGPVSTGCSAFLSQTVTRAVSAKRAHSPPYRFYAVFADNAFELNRAVLRSLDRLSPQHASPDSAHGVAADLLLKVALSPMGGMNLGGVTTILCEVLTRGRSGHSAVQALNAAVQQRFALMPLEYQRVRGRMDAFLSSRLGRGLGGVRWTGAEARVDAKYELLMLWPTPFWRSPGYASVTS